MRLPGKHCVPPDTYIYIAFMNSSWNRSLSVTPRYSTCRRMPAASARRDVDRRICFAPMPAALPTFLVTNASAE